MTLQQIEKINPDEKGIIKVTEDGRERRFIKEILIAWLKANQFQIKHNVQLFEEVN